MNISSVVYVRYLYLPVPLQVIRYMVAVVVVNSQVISTDGNTSVCLLSLA